MVSESSRKTTINRNFTSSKYGKEVYEKSGELVSRYEVKTNHNRTSSSYGQPILQERRVTTISDYDRDQVRENQNYTTPKQPFPEPQADSWELIRQSTHPKAVALDIKYPDCINYEGRKILVIEIEGGFSAVMKKNGGILDPHFFEGNNYARLIARFEPTEKGWQRAINLAKSI